MGDCVTCNSGKKMKIVSRPYRSLPRHMTYTATPSDTPRYVYTNKIRTAPIGCDVPCSTCPSPVLPVSYTTTCPSNCITPCSCPPPCPDTQCYYCPGDSDSGFLHSIRNGFQRIFNGRKRAQIKGKVYQYSTSQLKCLEQCLCRLESEALGIENAIKEAFSCDYRLDYNDLVCLLNNVMEQVEGIRCDLMCACDCYDPCRDKCEYDLIEALLERTNSLECLINDLCMQLECLEHQYNSCAIPCEVNCRKACCVKQPACKPDCRKPCCYVPLCSNKPVCEINCRKPCENRCRQCCVKVRKCRVGCRKPCCVKPPQCEIGCTKPCCAKRRTWQNGSFPVPGLCSSSSVIPVGVMLVKL